MAAVRAQTPAPAPGSAPATATPAQPEVVRVPQAAPAAPRAGAQAGQAAPVVLPPPVQTELGGPITAGTVRALDLEAGSGVLLQLPRPASTVINAAPGVARVTPASPTSLFVVGVSIGRTNVIVTDEAGAPVIQYDVSVRRAGGEAPGSAGPASGSATGGGRAGAGQIEAALRQQVPGAAGVKIALVEGALVLTGTVPTPAVAQQVDQLARILGGENARLVNRLEVLSSMQVNVRVRVAEMKRSVARDLGINWQVLGKQGNFAFSFFTPSGGPLPVLGNSTSNTIGVGYRNGNWAANGVIDALASNGLVSILSEPNLTTMSGEPASFLSGGEYPFQVVTGTGTSATVGYQFKQYGVSLAVVPTVIAPGRISMRVAPEVSELDFSVSTCTTNNACTPPGLTTRRAEATLELGSGQSFALGGLLSNKIEDNHSTLPWLGEIPVLGALFKQTKFSRTETELVIIVTPFLVRPVDSVAQLRAPTDGFRSATDLGRLLYGRQIQGGDVQARPELDAGFILK